MFHFWGLPSLHGKHRSFVGPLFKLIYHKTEDEVFAEPFSWYVDSWCVDMLICWQWWPCCLLLLNYFERGQASPTHSGLTQLTAFQQRASLDTDTDTSLVHNNNKWVRYPASILSGFLGPLHGRLCGVRERYFYAHEVVCVPRKY